MRSLLQGIYHNWAKEKRSQCSGPSQIYKNLAYYRKERKLAKIADIVGMDQLQPLIEAGVVYSRIYVLMSLGDCPWGYDEELVWER